MKIHNVEQGTPEWHKLRAEHFTASQAPAMMNCSPYMSRRELLDMQKTGAQKEVTEHQQRIFDRGHETEAMARVIVERDIIGNELFPVVGTKEVDGLNLLASFDGLTMMMDIGFEHKLWSETTLAKFSDGKTIDDLPEYYWQLEQQLLVSEADYILFVVSDGTKENMQWMRYEAKPERRAQLIAGWHQFKKDLETHDYTPAEIAPFGEKPESLPTLKIQVTGSVLATNMDAFKSYAMDFIDNIKTELATDQDFADAQEMVKFCKDAEKQLADAKKAALAQTADINDLFNTIDDVAEALRQKRLLLDKLVKSEKEARKAELVKAAMADLAGHLERYADDLRGFTLNVQADFWGVIKGKSSLTNIKDAIDAELANNKAFVTAETQRIVKNWAIYDGIAGDKGHLFPDVLQFIGSDMLTIESVVKARIADEAARIQAMEAEKAAKAEAAKQAQENQEKAKAIEAENTPEASQVEAELTVTDGEFWAWICRMGFAMLDCPAHELMSEFLDDWKAIEDKYKQLLNKGE